MNKSARKPIRIDPKKTPWIVVLDTETTKVRDGEIIEVGAIRVNAATFEVVSEYYSSLPKPSKARTNEFGEKHYNRVKSRCESSPERKFVLDEFIRFLRGPEQSPIPLLMGYSIREIDLPMLERHVDGWEHWLFNASVVDVAYDIVFNLWERPTDENDCAERKQVDVAKALGVEFEEALCHDPLYDCKVTLKLFRALEDLKKSKKAIPPLTKLLERVQPKKENNPIGTNAPEDVPEQLRGVPEQTTTARKRFDPKAPWAVNWVAARYVDPKFSTIRCPKCGAPAMTIKKTRTVVDADSYFYACAECEATMNVDGTKGKGLNRVPVCDLETLIIEE